MTQSLPTKPHIAVIAANSAWNIVNFRRPLVVALVREGWRIVVIAPDDGNGAAIRELGAEFVPIRIDSSGTSIVRDVRLVADYLAVLSKLRPTAFFGFTVKPNIYGSLAAHILGIRTINTISGLGTAFLRRGPLNWLVRRLYRVALGRSHRVFFQNRHDRDLFVEGGLVSAGQAGLVPGSGIALDDFEPRAKSSDAFRFLFVGRLLRDKGLIEYVDAARLLRADWPEVDFAILGFAESDNRTAVPLSQVERWQAEKIVTYLGETDDVRPFLAEADCVVLPSYREGLPRSLLEAAAMARPMVATDVPGCRDVVTNGQEGFLCEVRSARSLADAMEAMLRLGADERTAMGKRARKTVEEQFDQRLVVAAYLDSLR